MKEEENIDPTGRRMSICSKQFYNFWTSFLIVRPRLALTTELIE